MRKECLKKHSFFDIIQKEIGQKEVVICGKYVGIIVAMQEELEQIRDIMKTVKVKQIDNLNFYEGTIHRKNYVIVKSGIGKVNAARTTQVMIDQYNLDYILNIGSAGALHDDLDLYDFILGKDVVQHDFDITAFGHEKGYITDIGTRFHSSEILMDQYKKRIQGLKNGSSKVKIGMIATGDKFLTDMKSKEILKDEFNADCVEMEAAAVGQVCTLCGIPFIAIKAVSDKCKRRKPYTICGVYQESFKKVRRIDQ